MKKILFYLCFCILLFGNVYADTNGVWHFAEDIHGGIFGQNELGVVNYTFINPVYFKTNTYTTNLFNSGKIGIKRNTARVELDVNGSIYADNINTSYDMYVNGSKVVTEKNIGEYTLNFENVEDVINIINKADPGNSDVAGSLTYYGGTNCGADQEIAWKRISTSCNGATTCTFSSHCGNPRGCSTPSFPMSGTSSCTTSGDSQWKLSKPAPFTCNYVKGICPSSRVTSTCVSTYRVMCLAKTSSSSVQSNEIALNLPNSGLIANLNHGSSGSKTFKYTLPASFVNTKEINRITALITISTGWNGGSGYDKQYVNFYLNGKNSGNNYKSNTVSLKPGGDDSSIKQLVTVDFNDVKITNNNLELVANYYGGDDDQFVKYTLEYVTLYLNDDNGGVTTLNPN